MESLREVTLICFVVLLRAVFFILKWAVLIVMLSATYAFLFGVGYELGEGFNWLRGYGQ
jgi:hypothetical protein